MDPLAADSLSVRGTFLPRVMLAADLARACGCSLATARKWLRDGRVPGAKFGRRWLVSREALVARIEAASHRRSPNREASS